MDVKMSLSDADKRCRKRRKKAQRQAIISAENIELKKNNKALCQGFQMLAKRYYRQKKQISILYEKFEMLKQKHIQQLNDQKNAENHEMKTEFTSTLGLKTNIRRNRVKKNNKNKFLDHIKEFFDREDNSRATAGKKEYKTIQKLKLQSRYLLEPIKKLHEKYLLEGGKASLSTFRKYRPFYILTPKISNRNSCIKHSNMELMVKQLKQLEVLKSEDFNDIASILVCDLTSQTCMYGMCESCKENEIIADETLLNLNDTISWPVWMLKKHEFSEESNQKSTKKMVKIEREGSIQELISKFNLDMKKFLIHLYNISHQHESYKFCINNLKENESVIQIDFSENYVCKLHTEIQALHSGSSKVQITLHTAVMYIKGEHKPKSFCAISPANIHSPEAIWAYLAPVLQHLKLSYPQVDTVHFFSDGSISRYRNKKNCYLLSQIQNYGIKHATWSFFEASHRKGVAENIGGAIKRTLDSKVAHGENIPDAKTAFKVLSNYNTSIKVFYISEENIIRLQPYILKSLKPLPNTLKIHQVITKENSVVNFRDVSCFCRGMSGKCDCYSVKSHKFDISNTSVSNDILKTNKRRKSLRNKSEVGKKKTRLSSSKTSTESIEIKNVDNSNATHCSAIIVEEQYLDIDDDSASKIYLKEEKIFEGTTEDETNQISTETKKTALQKGVTILSDIKNTPRSQHYFDLKIFEGLQLTKIDRNFDVWLGRKPSDDPVTEEIIDPYLNPVPSTSGINQNHSAKKWTNNVENNKSTENFQNQEYQNCSNNVKADQTINSNEDLYRKENVNALTDHSEEQDLKEIKINEYVLVRYYNRKTWKFYIGRVIEINTKIEEDTEYTVSFLKTIKKPSLKFKITKRLDVQIVPSYAIVKTIELKTSCMKEYNLKNDTDTSYFLF